jgi:hypothetical protein
MGIIHELCESYKQPGTVQRILIVAIEWGLFAAILLWGDFL